MNKVILTVERLKLVPGAHVDCSFRQGRDAILAQIGERTWSDEEHSSIADQFMAEVPGLVVSLQEQVAPNRLPDDYVFFLEFYGGALIKTTKYNLLVHGMGPMVEEWYDDIQGDDWMYEKGLLLFSVLVLWEKKQYVKFFLDLAGEIRQYCVIGVPSGETESDSTSQIIQALHTHLDQWAKTADSFTGWLERAVETNGSFGYA